MFFSQPSQQSQHHTQANELSSQPEFNNNWTKVSYKWGTLPQDKNWNTDQTQQRKWILVQPTFHFQSPYSSTRRGKWRPRAQSQSIKQNLGASTINSYLKDLRFSRWWPWAVMSFDTQHRVACWKWTDVRMIMSHGCSRSKHKSSRNPQHEADGKQAHSKYKPCRKPAWSRGQKGPPLPMPSGFLLGLFFEP
jgi:hypothetical protein